MRAALSRRRLLLVAGGALGLAACRARAGNAELPAPRPAAEADPAAEPSLMLVVPWAPGGTSDLLMRLVAEHLGRSLAEPVTVQNITGGGGTIGARRVLGAPPDGQTLLAAHEWLITAQYIGVANLSWRDFEPVALLFSSPEVVVVRADRPWRTGEDLLADARRKPESLSWGATFGSVSHFLPVEVMYRSDTSFRLVGYEGFAERLDALLAGEVDVISSPLASVIEAVRAGSVRPVALAGAERLSALPQVPTWRETGVDIAFTTKRGLFAPPGTPASVLARLEDAARRTLADPELVQRAAEQRYAQAQFLDRAAYRDELERCDAVVRILAERMGLPRSRAAT